MKTLLVSLALASALFVGCAHPPQPIAVQPTYNDVVTEQYCRGLWARGYPDDQASTCRRWFDMRTFQAQTFAAAQQNYEESERKRKAIGDALEQYGQAMQQRNRTTDCTSNAIGSTVYTSCR